MEEFGRKDFLEIAVNEILLAEYANSKVMEVLKETRRRWPTGLREYYLQTEADLSAFRYFSLVVLSSESSMKGGMKCLKLIRGTEHIRKLIGTFLLLGKRKFWDHIKVCTRFQVGKSPLDTLTVVPDPNQFEYALRRACFKTLKKMKEKGITYRGCLSKKLVRALIVCRIKNFRPFESSSEKRMKEAYCFFLNKLTDSEEDKFWENVDAAYKKRVGNSQ